MSKNPNSQGSNIAANDNSSGKYGRFFVPRRTQMNPIIRLDFSSTLKAALLGTSLVAAPLALAEDAPPSYKAFPDVYKLVHESDQFLVIEATWKPGQKDALHSHLNNVLYWITDCSLRAEIPGGQPIEGTQKAGTSVINPAVSGHVATNVGKKTCKLLIVERK
ncbi:MAG: cupin domain-containing protein [Candidatus Binatia bacterium]